MGAVASCVAAATGEWDVSWQKRMLGAANFGMYFSYRRAKGNVEPYPPGEMMQEFVEGAQAVRVLNALRAPGVWMALTADGRRQEAHALWLSRTDEKSLRFSTT